MINIQTIKMLNKSLQLHHPFVSCQAVDSVSSKNQEEYYHCKLLWWIYMYTYIGKYCSHFHDDCTITQFVFSSTCCFSVKYIYICIVEDCAIICMSHFHCLQLTWRRKSVDFWMISTSTHCSPRILSYYRIDHNLLLDLTHTLSCSWWPTIYSDAEGKKKRGKEEGFGNRKTNVLFRSPDDVFFQMESHLHRSQRTKKPCAFFEKEISVHCSGPERSQKPKGWDGQRKERRLPSADCRPESIPPSFGGRQRWSQQRGKHVWEKTKAPSPATNL